MIIFTLAFYLGKKSILPQEEFENTPYLKLEGNGPIDERVARAITYYQLHEVLSLLHFPFILVIADTTSEAAY